MKQKAHRPLAPAPRLTGAIIQETIGALIERKYPEVVISTRDAQGKTHTVQILSPYYINEQEYPDQ